MSNYIKVEDVQEILDNTKTFYADNEGVIRALKNEINYLQTINLDDYRKRKIVCGDPFPPRDR